MKYASIHLPSALGGAALLGFVLLASGVAQSDGTVSVVVKRPVEVVGQPRARDMVRLSPGTPFLVPTGKTLVVTSLVNSYPSGTQVILVVDGVEVFEQNLSVVSGTTPSATLAFEPGFTVGASSTLTVNASGGANTIPGAYALGYLEDE